MRGEPWNGSGDKHVFPSLTSLFALPISLVLFLDVHSFTFVFFLQPFHAFYLLFLPFDHFSLHPFEIAPLSSSCTSFTVNVTFTSFVRKKHPEPRANKCFLLEFLFVKRLECSAQAPAEGLKGASFWSIEQTWCRDLARYVEVPRL